ncbi:MAG: hypothetical protein PVI90_13490, partial [Desulfobacteraceae bacterium]
MKNKIFLIIGLIALIFLLSACGESDLLDPYFVKDPRILAVKIEDPEVMPGDTVSMRMLVGGKEIEQDMANTVIWAIDDVELEPLGVSGYTQEFTHQIPNDFLGDNEWYDLPIYASLQINEKNLIAQKLLRLTQDPVGKNPVISHVQIRYINADNTVQETVESGETYTLPQSAANVAFTAFTEDLLAGENDKLIYRWYVSTSKDTNGMLYVQEDEDKIENLLGDGVNASELFRSVVFSLKGEENDKDFQTGIYD